MAKSETFGISELTKAFRELKVGMSEQRVGRAMVASGGAVLKRKAKANAQALGLKRTGALIKNIVIKRETQAPPGTVQYHLGVRHGRHLTKKQKASSKLGVNGSGRIVKRYDDDPYYWMFLELETDKRDATPYLAPALEQGKEEVIDAMAKRLQREQEKAGKQ